MIRLFLYGALALTLSGCSWFSRKNKSSAHMYEGDTSPVIKMYDESPGSPLHN